MNNNDTEQLVERAKNGDRTAVDELYRIYSEPLRKFIIKQGLSEFDAQDVVSETFMSMMEHIGQLRENGQFSTWLHTIAKRKAGEHREKAARHQRVDFNTLNSEDGDLSNIDGDSAAIDLAFEEAYGDTVMLPEDHAVNEEIKQIVAEQINSLSPEHREALFLFYYQDKSLAEIAELTGTNTNNVKARLFNARKNIKKKLEELQKKGIVLCAVPFTKFVHYFRDAFGNGAAEAAAALSNAQAAGSSAAADPAAAPLSPAAGAAASSSGAGEAAAASGIGLKAVAIAIAAAVAVGVAAAIAVNLNRSKDRSVSVGVEKTTIVTTTAPETELEAAPEMTTTAATTSAPETETTTTTTEPEPEPTLSAWKEQYIAMIEEIMTDDTVVYFFALRDLDEDGVPEMDVSFYEPDNIASERLAGAIFTFKNGKAIRLDTDEQIMSYIHHRYTKHTYVTGKPVVLIYHDWYYTPEGAYFDEVVELRYKIDENGISEMILGEYLLDTIPDESTDSQDLNRTGGEISTKAEVIREIVDHDDTYVPSNTSSDSEPDEHSHDKLNDWQQAYYKYISDYAASHRDYASKKFALYDVNGDGIPEMFVYAYFNKGKWGIDGLQSFIVTYNDNGGCSELMIRDEFTDPEGSSTKDVGYFFTGNTDVIGVRALEFSYPQAADHREYYYKIENGGFTKLSDEIVVNSSKFGVSYSLNGAKFDESGYQEKRAELLGSSEMHMFLNVADAYAERIEPEWFTTDSAIDGLAGYGP